MHALLDELPLTATPMNPTPLSTAFPALCAEAQENRPLIASWLCHVIVTDIYQDRIVAHVPEANKPSYEGLTGPTTQTYLNAQAAKHLDFAGATFELSCLSASPEAPQKPSRQHNKLTLQQQLALGGWVKNNAERATTDSDNKLAQIASVELSFTVTQSNISSTREALGIVKVKPAAPPTIEERVSQLEGLVEELTQRMVKLLPLEIPTTSPE